MISNDRKRGKLKRLSIRRKRNQLRCCKYQREKAAKGKPNPC